MVANGRESLAELAPFLARHLLGVEFGSEKVPMRQGTLAKVRLTIGSVGFDDPRPVCTGGYATRSSSCNRTELLRLWPTPRASANENRQTKPTPSQEAGQHGMNLATTAAL